MKKIAITGTSSGLGKALKNALPYYNEIICFDSPEFDLYSVIKVDEVVQLI